MRPVVFHETRGELFTYSYYDFEYPIEGPLIGGPGESPDPWPTGLPIGQLGFVIGFDVQVAIYLGILATLARGLECYIVPVGDGNSIVDYSSLTYNKIRWEYIVRDESGAETGYTPGPQLAPECRDGVFKRATESTYAPLVTVRSFADLYDCFPPVYWDFCSRINMYGILPGRHPDLLKDLNSSKQPFLAKILRPQEFFAALTVRNIEEDDYGNTLILKFTSDESRRLQAMSDWYSVTGKEIEDNASKIDSWDMYFELLHKLALECPSF